MIVSNRQTEKTSPNSAASPNQGPSLSGNPRAPALSSRPWFFSLLPVADIRHTEASLNTVQRRFAGVIRLITGLPLFAKDARTALNESEALLKAAKQGTVKEVEKHISFFADINGVDAQGMNAIMYAAERGDLGMIKLLVAAGSRINMGNKEGKDALMLAAKNGHADVVDYLITWGADFTRADNKGRTAFVLAARAGKTAVIQSFIDAGVDIDAPIDNGSTPLMFAAESGRVEFVKELIAKGAKFNKTNLKCKMTAVMYAAQNGKTEVVKLLLEHGARVDAEDAERRTALMIASLNGHIDVVKLFVGKGARVDAEDKERSTAMMKAAFNGHIDVVKFLVGEGARVDAKDKERSTAMMKAASNGHIDVVKFLVGKGARVDAEDKERSTAMMKAAFNGHIDVIKFLVNRGAKVNPKAAERQTALMVAAWQGHTAVVEYLLEQGAIVDAKNPNGLTALMMAAYRGHNEVVKILLANKASVKEKNKSGLTPLMMAAGRGNYATLNILIESIEDQYNELLSVLEFETPLLTKLIVRAWLNSTKNKLDAVVPIMSVFASGPGLSESPTDKFNKKDALSVLANCGLTLTLEEFNRLTLSVEIKNFARDRVKNIFVDHNDIPRESRFGNAYWSDNHALVDELIDAPFKTVLNPLGLAWAADGRDFNPEHSTSDNGDYLHAIGRLHDQSPKLTWLCDVDPMIESGWRSMVTLVLRTARNAATKASLQISRLLADPERGFGLMDEHGQPVAASNIRLKDTLFALELERNERLNQMAKPPKQLPVPEPLSWNQKNQQKASKAQAKAILTSNMTYQRLKLTMPALAQAKDMEKNVRSGRLGREEAVEMLDTLMSETEKTYFEAPGITSELAYHWFISEVGEVYEILQTMRDKFKEPGPAV